MHILAELILNSSHYELLFSICVTMAQSFQLDYAAYLYLFIICQLINVRRILCRAVDNPEAQLAQIRN